MRELKASKADKDLVATEVKVLLGLKASLNQVLGVVPEATKAGNKKKGKK